MTDNGRVHPDCVNASNPYHECGVACLEQISQGQGRRQIKKSDFLNGIKEGGLSKQVNGERRSDSNCPKASNPYHQCDKFCSFRTAEASPRGINKESGSFLNASLSFGRKKKVSESRPRSPQNGIPVAKAIHPSDSMSSPRSPFSVKKRVESVNSQSSSSRQHSEESYSRDRSFDKGQVQSSKFVPTNGNIKPVASKNLSIDSLTCYAIVPPTKQEDDEKLNVSPEAASSPVAKNVEVKSGPIVEPLNFIFSGISHASEDSDDEVQSVISDSCVSVGKYHVRSNVASILQLILEKYGDIAANCRLESTSLRAYYLECLCSVVQELQSTSPNQLTKSKVKELLAVLKDVESAGIDVSWLQNILNLESARKELESKIEDLTKKEKEVADTKAQIEEMKAHLSELELESSHLSDAIMSIRSKVEKFHSKPWADQIL